MLIDKPRLPDAPGNYSRDDQDRLRSTLEDLIGDIVRPLRSWQATPPTVPLRQYNSTTATLDEMRRALGQVIVDLGERAIVDFKNSASISPPSDNPADYTGTFIDFIKTTGPANPASDRLRLYGKMDGKLYYRNSAGVETEIGGGSGDVEGPAVATDEAIARFDTTTGKKIQNSNVKINDTGDISLVSGRYFNWGTGEVRIVGYTSAGAMHFHADPTNTLAGSSFLFQVDGTNQIVIDDAQSIRPASNGNASLGRSTYGWAGLYLKSAAVIDFASDFTFTHSPGFLTANKDLRVTTPGTNAKSVVTRDYFTSAGSAMAQAATAAAQQALLPSAPTKQIFTSSGTWSKPSGCKYIKATIQGGGGGGGYVKPSDVSRGASGGGGGSGGCVIKWLDVTSISSLAVTVGAGGAGGTSSGGGSGGTSGLGTSHTYGKADGGAGGAGSTTGNAGVYTVPGGAPGAASNGDINCGGNGGDAGFMLEAAQGLSGAGAPSPFGGAARAKRQWGNGATIPGDNASGYGSGGSGAIATTTTSSANGGAGGAGIVIIEEFY